MAQSPSSEININSADKDFHRLLWNPRLCYGVHLIPQLYPILSKINAVHTLIIFL
jgi:hypothetical protein